MKNQRSPVLVARVGRQHDPGTAALSAAWNPDALLQYAAAEIAIDQPLRNFLNRRQQCRVAEAGLERPANENFRPENPPPTHTVSLGELVTNPFNWNPSVAISAGDRAQPFKAISR